MILADILSATILFAVPLMLVALGGMFSERSGVINIALESIMVIGALISCLFLSSMNAQYNGVKDQINKVMNSRDTAVFEEIVDGCREAGAGGRGGRRTLRRDMRSSPEAGRSGMAEIAERVHGVVMILDGALLAALAGFVVPEVAVDLPQ